MGDPLDLKDRPPSCLNKLRTSSCGQGSFNLWALFFSSLKKAVMVMPAAITSHGAEISGDCRSESSLEKYGVDLCEC